MILTCNYCHKQFKVKENNIGSRKKSIRLGLPIYCNRECAGLGRRTNETEDEKKIHKQWYDLFIRASMTDDERNLDAFQNAVYFQMDYIANPEKYKEIRKKKMPKHIEYCRQPAYKAKKHTYDLERNHKTQYGDFWEASIILLQLEKEIDKRVAKGELKLITKSQKRKRKWQRLQKQLTLNSLLRI